MHGLDAADQDPRAAKALESEYGPRDAFAGAMVLLDELVQLLRLAHPNEQAAVGLHADYRGRVGAALVDGDLLRHVVPTDGAFEECSGCGVIVLGTQQKINGGTVLVYGALKGSPLACDLDVVSSIHQLFPTERLRRRPTAASTGSILMNQRCSDRVIDQDPALGHHLLNVSKAQRVGTNMTSSG